MGQRVMLSVLVAAPVSAPKETLVGLLRDSGIVDSVECRSSVEEIRAFLNGNPVDLLLVDVDLEPEGGFAFIESMKSAISPALMFASTDDSRAVEAFRYQPLDFLLYSVNAGRLKEALLRAMDRALLGRLERGDRSIPDMLQRAREGVKSALRLMVKTAGRISFVRAEDIDWVEAERDYVRIHNAGKKHLLRKRISHLEQQLPRERFLRIHRSTIVNIDRIKELQPLSFGEYSVILLDGTRLTMSRSFRDRAFERLQSAA